MVAIGNLLLGGINSSWGVRWKNIVARRWAQITSFVIGLTIKIEGTPPQAPFFLVTNHLSYLDVLPLWRYLDATFVAKSELKTWPFFGVGTRILGVLFINRELKRDVRRMNEEISGVISDDQGVILFPEGTSTKGEKVLNFKSSLLQYPADKSIPVHFAAITYSSYDADRPAHKHICWWGDMPFFSHFWELLTLPGIEAEIRFGENAIKEQDRKILAKELRKEVSDLFIPVINSDLPTEKYHT